MMSIGRSRSSSGCSDGARHDASPVDRGSLAERRRGAVPAGRRGQGGAQGRPPRHPAGRTHARPRLREAVAAHARHLRGRHGPARGRRGVPGGPGHRARPPGIGGGRGPEPRPLGERRRRPDLRAGHGRAAGPARRRAGDQRAVRPRASLPGAGGFLHPLGARPRPRAAPAGLDRRRQQRLPLDPPPGGPRRHRGAGRLPAGVRALPGGARDGPRARRPRGGDRGRPRSGRRGGRPLHRRLDQHGAGGRAGAAAGGVRPLPAQRPGGRRGQAERAGDALPAGPPRRGDHRRRARWAAEHRPRPGGEPPPRPEVRAPHPARWRGSPVMSKPTKIVLAYSGGLDTSVILRWLIETYGAEVVAFTADLGQGDELIPVREKALKTGASRVHVADLREEFVRDFVFPVLRANAVYESGYLLGTSFARPLIARGQVEVARVEGADAVAHGATGKGNDQVRFELTYAALAPELGVVAPWREWDLRSRSDMMAYAERHGIPVPTTPERPYSMDRNLFHISYEGGILEDPWAEPPEKMFLLTVSPEQAPDVPIYVEVEFEAGTPVAVDGRRLGPVALLERVNRIGGENGVGRADLVENRYVGMKSRGVY